MHVCTAHRAGGRDSPGLHPAYTGAGAPLTLLHFRDVTRRRLAGSLGHECERTRRELVDRLGEHVLGDSWCQRPEKCQEALANPDLALPAVSASPPRLT